MRLRHAVSGRRGNRVSPVRLRFGSRGTRSESPQEGDERARPCRLLSGFVQTVVEIRREKPASCLANRRLYAHFPIDLDVVCLPVSLDLDVAAPSLYRNVFLRQLSGDSRLDVVP